MSQRLSHFLDRTQALQLFQQLHQTDENDWYRSSGRMTCKYCGLLYRQHPVEEIYNIDHRLCNGVVIHI